MIKKIIGVIIFIIILVTLSWVLIVYIEFIEQSRENYIKQSQINRDLQRCVELRNGGFFSSVGQPVGSTTPNPNPEQGYQRCLEQARNP